MDAYRVLVIVLLCNIIVDTKCNALTGGSLRSCDCIDEVDELAQQLEQTQQELVQTQQRLEQTEQRSEQTEQRLEQTEQRLKQTEQKFEQTEQRFEQTEQRLEQQQLEQEKQQLVLQKLTTTSLTGRVDNSDLNSLKRSKRGVPTTEENGDDIEDSSRCCGFTGAPGRDGRDGEYGRDGEDGKDGGDGRDGVDGRDGADGQSGEPGHRGVTGAPGRDGRDGADGRDGEDGQYGADGQPAEPGKDGVTGAQGRDGEDGKDGVNGRDGADGQPGEPGQRGVTGSPGSDGRNGADGRDGEDGEDGEFGKEGKDGLPGLPGISGPKGAPGSDGATGSQGLRGLRGYPGEDSTAEMEAGAVYTRWGRTTCGNQSTLVYEGFAGNSRHDYLGGGTNYQCLPLHPEYNKFSGNVNSYYWGTWMAGVEYEIGYDGIFPNTAENQNVPCARCYTENRAAVMMIPAKRTCPVDWTKEYEGYLMTLYVDHQATFECVDGRPEYIRGLEGNTDGGMFQFVKSYCSGPTTGHCPPYSDIKELTCVVCTK